MTQLASLLPNGMQQFVDGNGAPYANGKVYFYIPNTLTPSSTWQDPLLQVLNTNPVLLDGNGRAVIYGVGQYLQVLVDQFGNTIWSELTAGDGAVGDLASPEMFGAVGNGSTPDTGAWNALIAALNAGQISGIQCRGNAQYLVGGALTPITASNWAIFGNNATLLAQPGTWSNVGAGTLMFSISGATKFTLCDLIFNGQQNNFLSQPSGNLLTISNSSYPTLRNVSAINSPSNGVLWDTVSYGVVSGCHFDSNADVGWQRASCSYTQITGTSRSYNGYGYQKTWATNQFASFGEAVRFQSFNEIDLGGQFLFNGRDGANQNQGSNHNQYIGSIATGNGDGGFTAAADSTSVGRPGDGESPFSNKYTNVEAIANWGSGLVAYSQTDDIEYSGRFGNNCRLAGSIPVASSSSAGVYFAGGSSNIHPGGPVVTFDDRQTCPITAISGSGSTRVLTATNWLPGYKALYNTVAFFNASNVWQGYGFITAESAGSVTIQAATDHPVTLSSIATTWYVSQCTQTAGVFYDSGTQGEINAKGYGMRANYTMGPALAYTGSFASGQNVLLSGGVYGTTQLLANPTFDSAITNWTFNTPGGGSSSQITVGNVLSAGALQLSAGVGQNAMGDATLVSGAANVGGVNGVFLEYSGWIYSAAPQASVMVLFWDSATYFTQCDHPGGGYRFLRIGIFNNFTGGVVPRVQALNGNTIYADSMSLLSVQLADTNFDFARPSYLNSIASAPIYPPHP